MDMKNALCMLILVSACGCSGSPPPAPIYLGQIATTSGPGRAAGEQEVLGIRLAIEELTRTGRGVVSGRPIVVKHSDARGHIEAFESQAVRMIAVSRVVALYGGNTLEEMLRLDQSRVPLVTPLGFRPKGLSELVFSVGMAVTDQAQALAQFAVDEKDVKSLGIIVDERREQSRAFSEAFEREWQAALTKKHPKKENNKPLLKFFGKDAKHAELTQGLDKVQGVLFAGPAQDYHEWRKTLPSPPFAIFFGGEEGVLNDGAAYCASAFAVDKERTSTVEFAQKFREAFKEDPDVHAALAYEGIRLLVDAMVRSETLTEKRVLEELRKTKDYPGLAGPLTFGPDQQIRRPIFVGRMNGTAFSPVKCYP